MNRAVVVNLLHSLLPLAGCSAFMPEVRMGDLQGLAKLEKPSDKLDTNQWVSLSQNVQFLPVLEQQKQQKAQRERRLRKLEEQDEEDEIEYNPYYLQPFTEGMSDYNEYQQAWRMLGFMIDCDVSDGDNKKDRSHEGSRDGTIEDDGCARFIVWASVRSTISW
jgi:hypothetical protein